VDKLEHRLIISSKQQAQKPKRFADEGNNAKFPSSRYFQIHFQHIEAQLEQTNRSLEALLQQVATLQSRLAQAGIDLDHPNNE
jgi:chromosome segregation ATPase